MKSLRMVVMALLVAAGGLVFAAAQGDAFPEVINSQKAGEHPPTAAEAAAKITVPEGFSVTLFAGEPDVAQPISMTLDDRGRLWVVECYSYDGRGYAENQRDRIVIFEDTDNDGRHDSRKIFWDQGQLTTSVVWGFEGAWVLSQTKLLFIPDRDGDDVPDGEVVVKLDGFTPEASHNLVNGLMWGPDGWLYGRHGILATSAIGTPGAAPDKRVEINTGVWRYHPTRGTVEAVCHGTTNPWGMDYDDHGQMFFTNNVNGHLWHVIPGAHFDRMYGEDFSPYLYELMEQTADHYHWNTGEDWTKSREGGSGADALGGGHSHCGGMIYLGDNFPSEYRNSIFMANTHGRRINRDVLELTPTGYRAKHAPDFFFANQPWFRGTELRYGPDGGVYVSDWSDLGECHDHDGVHRTSGRIYKVIYGEPRKMSRLDIGKLSNEELVELQLHRNDWYVRTARRVLQERSFAGQDMSALHAALRQMFQTNGDVTRKLRAMWALYVTDGTTPQWLMQQLKHDSEHVRTWAIKLLVDDPRNTPADAAPQFASMARTESSGLVRLFLASAMQRLKPAQRWPIAAALTQSDARIDNALTLMVWYGLEAIAPAHPDQALALIEATRAPKLRQYLVRRLTGEIEQNPVIVDAIVRTLTRHADQGYQAAVLTGMAEALRGWRKAPPPESWPQVAHLGSSEDQTLRELATELSVVFGDGRAMDDLRLAAEDETNPIDERRNAIRVLSEARAPGMAPFFQELVADRDVAAEAIRGLAAYDDPRTADVLVKRFNHLRHEAREEAINTLASRPAYAAAMLEAIKAGTIPREMLTAYHARQIQAFNDPRSNQLLEEVWGAVRQTSAEKLQLIEKYKTQLTADALKGADLPKGRVIYNQLCFACHTLHGQGGKIGPDLTGANRDNLEYLLGNIIDPSAMVANDFRMAIVQLNDGRVVTGSITERTDRTITVQGLSEKMVLNTADVKQVNTMPMSLMPEGLLQTLSDEQVRDLIAYLMSKGQVELPVGQ